MPQPEPSTAPRPPRVSVIVPTLNRRADLLDFCGSLLAQTVRPHELIVVDAGQVPDMEAALQAALAGSGVALVYRKSRAGTSLQRNIALELVSGEFVLLCDDDLLLEPPYIERSLEAMITPLQPPVGCVLGTFSSPGRPRGWRQRYFKAFRMTHAAEGDKPHQTRIGTVRWLVAPSKVVQIPVASGGRTLYRAACFDGERFDEFLPGYTLNEDVELSYRIAKRWSIVQTPHARCFHKRSGEGRVDYGDRVSRLIYSQFYFFGKHAKKGPIELTEFVWNNVGTAIFYTGFGLAKGKPSEAKAVLRGIAKGYGRCLRQLRGLEQR